MRHLFTLGAVLLAFFACGGFGEANARSRSGYQTYSERADWRHHGYPGPGCTFAIREYQRRWPYQLWPPSMRCFPYPELTLATNMGMGSPRSRADACKRSLADIRARASDVRFVPIADVASSTTRLPTSAEPAVL